jgi:hypothetical protein
MGLKLALKWGKALYACAVFTALVLLAGCGGESGSRDDASAPIVSPTQTSNPAPTGTPTPSPAAACVSPSASPSAAISTIDFTPTNPVIDNPLSPDSAGAPSTITVNLAPHDDQGKPMTPTPGNPLQVEVFGAPDGAISPTTKPLISGTAFTFTYSGQYLANDLLLEAWIAKPNGTPTLGQYSIGTTLILRKNRQSPNKCLFQTTSFDLGTDCAPGTLPGNCANLTSSAGIQIQAAIGASPGTFHQYTVDTGSLGVLVPQSQVPAANPTPGETQIIGPAGPGLKYYDSNGGHTFNGQYWLAPVTFLLSDGKTTVTTHPIKVLVLPDSDPLDYMGIGFDRNSTRRGDYFNSPADNAFLNVTDGNAHGSDVSAGYTITPSSIMLGVTSTLGFHTTPLSPNQCVAGDYTGAAGCFSFPAQSVSFCGTMLMDTGIGDMYLNLRRDARPAGLNQCTSGKNCVVPDLTVVQINSGKSTAAPPICYQFATNATNTPPITPEPSSVNWSTSASDPTMKFVNTGRHPLAWFTYLYDSACGQIGFQPNSEYQQTCN